MLRSNECRALGKVWRLLEFDLNFQKSCGERDHGVSAQREIPGRPKANDANFPGEVSLVQEAAWESKAAFGMLGVS